MTVGALKLKSLKELFIETMAKIGSQSMILSPGVDLKNSGQRLHGMTLSSVGSLSVFPKQLLQFNLHLPSYTSHEIHKNRFVGIHLLPPTAKAAKIGRIFASGVKKEHTNGIIKPSDSEIKDGEVFHEMTTPFNKIDLEDWEFHVLKEHEIKIPILKESEAVFICEAYNTMLIDNHEIWVVQLRDMLLHNQDKNDPPSGGLLYFNRGFHQIGDFIEEK